MKKNKFKRWIPKLSFMDVTISIPSMLIIGLLMLTGKGIIFGIEGDESFLIPIPKVPIAGWLIIYITLYQFVPPIIRYRIKKRVKALKAYVKNLIKGESNVYHSP